MRMVPSFLPRCLVRDGMLGIFMMPLYTLMEWGWGHDSNNLSSYSTHLAVFSFEDGKESEEHRSLTANNCGDRGGSASFHSAVVVR